MLSVICWSKLKGRRVDTSSCENFLAKCVVLNWTGNVLLNETVSLLREFPKALTGPHRKSVHRCSKLDIVHLIFV